MCQYHYPVIALKPVNTLKREINPIRVVAGIFNIVTNHKMQSTLFDSYQFRWVNSSKGYNKLIGIIKDENTENRRIVSTINKYYESREHLHTVIQHFQKRENSVLSGVDAATLKHFADELSTLRNSAIKYGFTKSSDLMKRIVSHIRKISKDEYSALRGMYYDQLLPKLETDSKTKVFGIE